MVFYHGIAILEPGDDFPDPTDAPANEPVAVGFELTPELMLAGYRKGLFAWSVNPVTWWSPDPRAIISLGGFHVSKRLARKIKTRPFKVTMDRGFTSVVEQCARPRHRGDGVWITTEFRDAFEKLFEMGYAHSVECWRGAQVVGGVFGVALNGFFSAESMFHRETDASKIALYYLLELLRDAGFKLFDIQMLTAHTESLGAKEIQRVRYLEILHHALTVRPRRLGQSVLVTGTELCSEK